MVSGDKAGVELELTGRRALVTGGGKGIGRATAQALAREGVRVTLTSRTAAELEAVWATLAPVSAGAHRWVACDLFDATSRAELFEALGEDGVDILVANACSRAPHAKLHRLEPEAWEAFMHGEWDALFHLLRGLLPAMSERGWGRLLFVGSVAGDMGVGRNAAYGALKTGLEGLVRNLAIDYGRKGITANLVKPGVIDTERLRASSPEEIRHVLGQATSLKRLGTPEEVADVLCFLASERGAYVTGAEIPVAGGLGLNNLW